jgi:hypothetical protein
MKNLYKTLFVLFFVFVNGELLAQISYGGVPPSFEYPAIGSNFKVVTIKKPDEQLLRIDKNHDKELSPPRVGPILPVGLSLSETGTWSVLSDGSKICRLGIRVEGALALGLYYNDFNIPDGGRLFIYDPTHSHVIGAFTSGNNINKDYFATELVPGDECILEYHEPGNVTQMAGVFIDEVLYAHRHIGFLPNEESRGFGDSGECEVNVNCPEGQDWQREKRGVARILLKDGGFSFWCTGSLINNVSQDSTPYFLTANHCGQNASTSDYSQWIFYFNYESPGCANPSINPFSSSMSGSKLVSKSPNSTFTGSDFKLLLLDNKIPVNYNPYFNGWNRVNSPANNGVCIHHPQGDIKKISTYNTTLVSTSYDGQIPDPGEKYWKVIWAATQSGHGVTEGGSSGSPLFNNDGQIIGALTGGLASCTNLDAPDYYGKFSYSWESNGISDSARLRPWLDPDYTGISELNGFGYGDILTAVFLADTTRITIGSHIEFTDFSIGEPAAWKWVFEGGRPGTSILKEPGPVRYDNYGTYDVTLIIVKNNIFDTLIKMEYIRVGANMFPVPANDYLYLDFGRRKINNLEVELFDILGRKIKNLDNNGKSSKGFQINLHDVRAGMYFIKYYVDGMENPPEKIIKH